MVRNGLIVLFIMYWCFTFIQTKDMVNWLVENLPVFLFVLFFLWQRKTILSISMLSFVCIVLFVLMHISGSQYAYTHHPIGIWMKEVFHLQRNGFDRFVHFNFGFLITLPLTEFIKRKLQISNQLSGLMAFLFISTLAATFELIEWIIGGVLFPETGADYVGTQGDIWDPQKDIALAMLASLLVLIICQITRQLKSSVSVN